MSAPPDGNGTLAYRVAELEKDLANAEVKMNARFNELERKLDRIQWALVGLAISITSATLVLLLSAQVTPGG